MTTGYTSYESLALKYAINMLAASATFQTLVGAANATAAGAFIVESDGGEPLEILNAQTALAYNGDQLDLMAPPFAIVSSDTMDSQQAGVGVYDRSGSIRVMLFCARQIDGDNPDGVMRAARNAMGAIRSDLEALQGTAATYLATIESIDTEGPFKPDSTGPDAHVIPCILTINWYA